MKTGIYCSVALLKHVMKLKIELLFKIENNFYFDIDFKFLAIY